MDFLTILPDEGHYCLVSAVSGQPASNHWCSNKEQAAAAIQRSAKAQQEMWFAHASFASRTARAQANVLRNRAFVFDIDIMPPNVVANGATNPAWVKKLDGEGKPTLYESKREAFDVLKSRVLTKIPKPSIVVDSGYGFHCYWLIDNGAPGMPVDFEPQEWRAIAERFKAFLKAADPKLAADTTRVADNAGVLRVPGTVNHKYGYAADVKLVHLGRTCTLEQFTANFPATPQNIVAFPGGSPPGQRRAVPKMALGAAASPPPPDGDAAIMRDKCGAIKAYRERQDAATRDEWWPAIQLCAYIDNGHALAHELSRGTGYDQGEVDRQFGFALRAKADGQPPIKCETLCSKLGLDRAVTCAGCPQFGKTTASPVNLGLNYKAPPAVRPKVALTGTEGVEVAVHSVMEQSLVYGIAEPPIPDWLDPKNPDNYFVVLDNATLRWRAKRSDLVSDNEAGPHDGTGDELEFLDLTETATWPLQRYSRSGKSFETWARARPGRRRDTYEVEAGQLADLKGMRKALRTNGVALGMGEGVVNKALGRFADLANKHIILDDERSTKRFGWTDVAEGGGDFIVGGVRVSPHGYGVAEPIGDAASSDIRATLGHKGTVAGWCETLRLAETYGSDLLKWAVVLGFAAPIFTWSGQSGIVVHFWGNQSGYGKTSINRIATSIWGRPIKGHAGAKDTERSITNLIGVCGTLPACVEELTDMRGSTVTSLTYMVEHGKSPAARDGASGKLRDDDIRWATICLTNANISIVDAISDASPSSVQARLQRLFEINVDERTIPMGAEEGGVRVVDMINATLEEHHGMVGIDYATFLVQNRTKLRKFYRDVQAKFSKEASSDTERFFVALRTSMFVAATIMQMRGYWAVPKDFIDVMSKRMHKKYDQTSAPARTTTLNQFRAYIAAHDNAISIGGGHGFAPVLATSASSAQAGWGIRQKDGSVEYCLPRANVRKWAIQANISLPETIASAKTDGSLQVGPDGGVIQPRAHPRLGAFIDCFVVRLETAASTASGAAGSA